MINVNAILKAQACDNLPRIGGSHETQLANRVPDESDGGCEALPVDTADAGGDQADTVQPAALSLSSVLRSVLPTHFETMFEEKNQ